MIILLSAYAVAAKAQQLPQEPWSRTGVTAFEVLQSKLVGGAIRETLIWDLTIGGVVFLSFMVAPNKPK